MPQPASTPMTMPAIAPLLRSFFLSGAGGVTVGRDVGIEVGLLVGRLVGRLVGILVGLAVGLHFFKRYIR